MHRSASTLRSIRIGSGRNRITGDFGGSDGERAPEAQQGGAAPGEGTAGQAGRAPDPAFSEAAGADAAAAGGAGAPGPQRRHGAARRSGVAAGHRRPGGHGPAGQGRAPAIAADAVAAGGGVVGEGGCPRCCARGCSAWRGGDGRRWEADGGCARRTAGLEFVLEVLEPGSASPPTGPGRGPVPAGSCRSSPSGRANSSRAPSGC